MKSLILDSNNIIHRTFHVARNSAGEDDEKLDNFHVYYTLNAIRSYVAQYKPDKIYACWDEKPEYQQNERKTQFEDYKGNRPKDKTPHRNNEKIKKFLVSLGIPSVYPRKLEADDVIAYLCSHLEGKKVVISVDKDFLQLVNKDVIVYDPIRKKETNHMNFDNNVKCSIEDFLRKKSCEGDKSDNVPGIPGFGPVKTQKFLEGNIELTQAEQDIYDRNHYLFRLDRWNDSSSTEEVEYINNQLDDTKSIVANYKTFLELCESSNIQSIISKKEAWYTLFFAKQRLQSLFA